MGLVTPNPNDPPLTGVWRVTGNVLMATVILEIVLVLVVRFVPPVSTYWNKRFPMPSRAEVLGINCK